MLAAATALVGAMATDAWQHTRAAMADWARRTRRAEGLPDELDEARARLLLARERGDTAAESALCREWALRLEPLVDDPADLIRLLERPVVINATARDDARQFIAGRDMHVTGQ
ncbi:hypothetical protein FDA94_35560 [Herbidospora galbida]|uniref:Uncharacterized protein n=2 Tax=Herbidospora galbida TaxID=2575442 RepID=A0A4U3LX35_9ACTN|nr:hypothetical protein FDA94_35560 [Herbidospora galbida]